jgi:hemerythrin superfamily protein
MDIYSLIKDDHQRVTALFDRIEAAESGEGETRRRLFEALKKELTIHKEAEEATFYAALSNLPEITDRIEEAMEEHADVEELLQELEQLDSDSPAFATQISELREEVEHHVGEEETEIFRRAQELLTDEQADRLAREMQAEKERLMS